MAIKFDADLPFLDGFITTLGNWIVENLPGDDGVTATQRFLTGLSENGPTPLPSPPEYLDSTNAATSEPSGRGMGGDPAFESGLSISLGGDGAASTPSEEGMALSGSRPQSAELEAAPEIPQTPQITPPPAPPPKPPPPPLAPPPGRESMVVPPQIPVPMGIQTAQAPMRTAETVEAAVERLHRENRTTEDETRYTQSILEVLAAQNPETDLVG